MPELFSYATPEYVNDLFLQNLYLSWDFVNNAMGSLGSHESHDLDLQR